jgi:hypothetical protein
MLRQLSRDVSGLHFDDAMMTIGLRRLWDGRRDIVQLVPVQLQGMQAAWLNGAHGMVEGFKDPSTQVQSLPFCFPSALLFSLPYTYPHLFSVTPSVLSALTTSSLEPAVQPKSCERSSFVLMPRDSSASCSKKFWCL